MFILVYCQEKNSVIHNASVLYLGWRMTRGPSNSALAVITSSWISASLEKRVGAITRTLQGGWDKVLPLFYVMWCRELSLIHI